MVDVNLGIVVEGALPFRFIFGMAELLGLRN